MSKHATSASLHLCHPRAAIPGTQEERERDYAETLHREGPYLIRSELSRIRPLPAGPDNLLNRICQADRRPPRPQQRLRRPPPSPLTSRRAVIL